MRPSRGEHSATGAAAALDAIVLLAAGVGREEVRLVRSDETYAGTTRDRVHSFEVAVSLR